jgi:hypothetical protein
MGHQGAQPALFIYTFCYPTLHALVHSLRKAR